MLKLILCIYDTTGSRGNGCARRVFVFSNIPTETSDVPNRSSCANPTPSVSVRFGRQKCWKTIKLYCTTVVVLVMHAYRAIHSFKRMSVIRYRTRTQQKYTHVTITYRDLPNSLPAHRFPMHTYIDLGTRILMQILTGRGVGYKYANPPTTF
jgi:hypothetical protein